MTWHDCERMRFFMSIAEKTSEKPPETIENPKGIRKDVVEARVVLRELNKAIAKIDSYYQNGSEEYQNGIIDGLNYSVEILSLLKRELEGKVCHLMILESSSISLKEDSIEEKLTRDG